MAEQVLPQQPVDSSYQSSWKPKTTVTFGQSPCRSRGKLREGRSGIEEISVHWAYTLFSPITLRKAKGKRVRNEMWSSPSEMEEERCCFKVCFSLLKCILIGNKLLLHKLSPQQGMVSKLTHGWAFILQSMLTHDSEVSWEQENKLYEDKCTALFSFRPNNIMRNWFHLWEKICKCGRQY